MEIGGDWEAYVEHFKFYREANLFQALGHLDPGYGFVNWLVARAGLSFIWTNLVCACIFCWGLGRFLKIEPSPWLALVVAVPYLIIVVAMGYTRQAVAIGFLLAGIVDFQKHNSLLRLAAYIAGGALFHKTVVVMFPVLALAQDRSMLVKGVMMMGLAVLLYAAFASSAAETLYSNYVTEEYDAAGALIRLSMNAAPAILFLLARKRFHLIPLAEKIWRNIAIAALVLLAGLVFFSSTVFLDRLGLYLIPIQLMVFGRLPFIGLRSPYSAPMALGVIALYATVLFAWLNTGVNAQWWVPYEMYLPSEKNKLRLEEGGIIV
jgi:hypothetical protein